MSQTKKGKDIQKFFKQKIRVFPGTKSRTRTARTVSVGRKLEPDLFFLIGTKNRARKRGHYKKGLFTGGISRTSAFSRISRKWSDSLLFSTVWGFSRIAGISEFSRISRKWTSLKGPLSKRPLFPNPKKNHEIGPISPYFRGNFLSKLNERAKRQMDSQKCSLVHQ